MKSLSPALIAILAISIIIFVGTIIYVFFLLPSKTPSTTTTIPVTTIPVCPDLCEADSDCATCLPRNINGRMVCRDNICAELIVTCNSVGESCITIGYKAGTVDAKCDCIANGETIPTTSATTTIPTTTTTIPLTCSILNPLSWGQCATNFLCSAGLQQFCNLPRMYLSDQLIKDIPAGDMGALMRATCPANADNVIVEGCNVVQINSNTGQEYVLAELKVGEKWEKCWYDANDDKTLYWWCCQGTYLKSPTNYPSGCCICPADNPNCVYRSPDNGYEMCAGGVTNQFYPTQGTYRRNYDIRIVLRPFASVR